MGIREGLIRHSWLDREEEKANKKQKEKKKQTPTEQKELIGTFSLVLQKLNFIIKMALPRPQLKF